MATYLNPNAYAPARPATLDDPYRSSLQLSALMQQTPGFVTTGPRGKMAHSAIPRKQGGKQDVYDEAIQHWIASGTAQAMPMPQAPTQQQAATKPIPQPIPQPVNKPTLPTPSRSPHAAVNQQHSGANGAIGKQFSPVQEAIEQLQAAPIATPAAQSFDLATLAALLSQLGVIPTQPPVATSPQFQPQSVPTLPAAIQQPSPQEQAAQFNIAQNRPLQATAPKPLSGKGTEIKLKTKQGEVVEWIRDRFLQRLDGVVLQLSLTATLPNGRVVDVPLENGGSAPVRTFDSGGAGFFVGGRASLTDAAGDKWRMQVGCNISATAYLGAESGG